jgi:hypothetical protein
MDVSSMPPARKVDVTSVAEPYREEVRDAIKNRYGGIGPKLVAFLANKVRSLTFFNLHGPGLVPSPVCITCWARCDSWCLQADTESSQRLIQ